MTPRTALLPLIAFVLAAVAAPSPPAATAQEPVRIEMRRIVPKVFPGQTVWLGGRITGPERKRSYVVQQQLRDGSWKVVRHDFTGSGSVFAGVTAPRRTGPVTWRLVVPAVRRDGRLLARLVSPPRTTRVVVQRVRVNGRAAVEVGTRVRLRVQLSPYVRGQSVTIRQVVNGHPQRVTQSTVRPEGTVFRFTQLASGPTTYQVVAATVTVTKVVRGTPSSTVLPTRRISTTSDGSQLSLDSEDATASDDGRWVAFVSRSDNAVRGDTNKRQDVFLKDNVSGRLVRVSHGPRGVQSDGDSFFPFVSGDGSAVAFMSRARNLVTGDVGDERDVFVWDRATDTVTRVGLGSSRPVLSADGRWVAYTSDGVVELRDRETGAVAQVTSPLQSANEVRLSADGSTVAYTATDGVRLWDRATGATELVVPDATSAQLDADASVVAYEASAGDARQVYVLDRSTGTATLVSTPDGTTPGDDRSRVEALTPDGTRVLFTSAADLVEDDVDTESCESEAECYGDQDYDAFVADLTTGELVLASRSATGEPADLFAEGFDITADGDRVVFGSRDVLVPGQRSRSYYLSTYAWREIFVRDLDTDGGA